MRNSWFSFLRRFLASTYLYSIPLVLALSAAFVYPQENVIELTNSDVLAMVREKLSTEAIVKRIQNSVCHFDTFPTVISELRYKGVPEEVLVAMVAAPIGRPTKPIQKKSPGPLDREKPLTDAPIKTPGPTTNPGSANTASSSKSSKTVVPVLAKEKAAVGPVTSEGKAPQPRAPLTPTMAAVPSVQKQNTESMSATMPLPEPVKLESVVSAKPKALVIDSSTPPPSSKSIVVSGETEVAQATKPKEQSKQPELSPHILSNPDIIKLLRGGSSVSVVVDTIKATPGNYDLSAKALLELRDAGADASVFLSMMEINRKAVENKTNIPATSAAVPSKP